MMMITGKNPVQRSRHWKGRYSNGSRRENDDRDHCLVISIKPSLRYYFTMSTVSRSIRGVHLYSCDYMRAINKEWTRACACEGNPIVQLRCYDCRMGRTTAFNKGQGRQNLPSWVFFFLNINPLLLESFWSAEMLLLMNWKSWKAPWERD